MESNKHFEVKLNPNGFHRKIQLYVFPKAPLYQNLCPYFWLTIFCFIFTFVLPIVPLCKGAVYLVEKAFDFFEWLIEAFDEKICQPWFESVAKQLDGVELINAWVRHSYFIENEERTPEKQEKWEYFYYNFYETGHMGAKQKAKLEAKFEVFKKVNPDWEQKLQAAMDKAKVEYEAKKVKLEIEAKERHEADKIRWTKEAEIEAKRRESAKGRAERAKKAQNIFTWIIKLTKYPFWILMGVGVGAIGVGIYKLFAWIVGVLSQLPWETIMNEVLVSLVVIGGIILASLIVMGIGFLIFKLVKKCKISWSDINPFKSINVPFKDTRGILWKGFVKALWNTILIFVSFGKFIGSIFTGTWSGIKFVAMYFMQTKDDYCPAITWTNEEKVTPRPGE